jgi:hypothetical protein
MADRNLPLGQITPVARPIGAFVQAAQAQPAAPARPTQLDNPTGISTIQIAGRSSVAGYNQFEQLATALAPFSKALGEVVGQGYLSYAKGKIDEGYYEQLQQLRNEQAKATLSLQVQAETGAADAASQIGQLQKVDPIAAQLLNESNPWKLVGRRRALAQVAGSEIQNVLDDDLTTNAGELSKFQPGSPELTKRQVGLTSQVLDRYGLTGDEPEVQFYVTPKLNQAWDKYRDQQRKFYDAAVEESTRNSTVAGMAATVEEMLTNGVTINGVTYKPGTPEWAQYGGAVLTYGLDQQLRLMAPDGRKRTVQFLREQIIPSFNDPLGKQLLQNVRGGDPSMPFEKRPTWAAMAPFETLELEVRGQEAAQKTYDLKQKNVEQRLDQLWYGTPEKPGPGSFDLADPAYPAELLKFRRDAIAMGYLTPEEYISRRAKDQSEFTQVVRPPDPFAVDNFIVSVEQVGPGAWTDDPNAYQNALREARQIADLNPTPEGKREDYQRMVAAIGKARDAAGEFDPGVKDKVTSAVLQDLDSQAVRQIKGEQKVNGKSGDALAQALAQSVAGGASATQAVSAAYQNTKLTAAANRLTALYERALSTAIRNWKGERPGQVMSPSARSVVMSEAEAAVRNSPEWARVMKELTGRNPGEVGPRTVGNNPQDARGVPRAGARSLPDSSVRNYQQRPVMEGQWVRDELVRLQQNKPVSPELYNTAVRAGTSTYRYLLEQLKFYPRLDPSGDAKRWLEEKVKQQRANRTVSSNQLPSLQGSGLGMVPVGYNPLRPGGWLMRLFTPPVAAATLDSMGGGRNGGGPFMDSGQWRTGPAVATSHPETGRGYTVPGARDASGRPVVLSQAAANSFAAMMRDSGGRVRASDVASAQRTDSKNRAVGGVAGSEHLGGNAMDIHGTSIAWIRKNGARYGWYVNDYDGSHGGHVEFRGGGSAPAVASTRRGGGMTGMATYYTGSGGSDGVAGGPTANGEIYDPNKMTAAVQWSLRGKYLNKWVKVEDLDTGRTVRVWVNDVGQMGGTRLTVNQRDPRVIDLSPAAFRKLFGSTSRGVGRVRIVEN